MPFEMSYDFADLKISDETMALVVDLFGEDSHMASVAMNGDYGELLNWLDEYFESDKSPVFRNRLNQIASEVYKIHCANELDFPELRV